MSDPFIEYVASLKGVPGYSYVATPYGKYAGGLDAAYIAACRIGAALMKLNIPVYVPIAHTHGMALYGEIDARDNDFWLLADAPLMDMAHGLIVVRLPGWEESDGVAREIGIFSAAGKPIIYVDPLSLI